MGSTVLGDIVLVNKEDSVCVMASRFMVRLYTNSDIVIHAAMKYHSLGVHKARGATGDLLGQD